MKTNFNLENVLERAQLIKVSNNIFGNEEKVFMKCSDSLSYVFNNITEAIIFILYRVKEIDYSGTFTKCRIGNINSKDVYLSIKTDVESYIIKTLNSYLYTDK